MECLEDLVAVSCFFHSVEDSDRVRSHPSVPATRQEPRDTPRKREKASDVQRRG